MLPLDSLVIAPSLLSSKCQRQATTGEPLVSPGSYHKENLSDESVQSGDRTRHHPFLPTVYPIIKLGSHKLS